MLKTIGQLAGFIICASLRIRFAVLRHILDADRAMSLTSEHAGRIPGLLGIYARQSFYKHQLKACGNDVHFGYQTLLSKCDASIGDRVFFGRFCTMGRVTIGDDTLIADGVQLLSGQHHHGSTRQGVDNVNVNHSRITIGKNVWIGANAVVMADVGDGAIVGAGAVVTKPVAAGLTVAGVPAKAVDVTVRSRCAA